MYAPVKGVSDTEGGRVWMKEGKKTGLGGGGGKIKEVSHALVEYVRASHVGAVGAPPH